MTNMQVVYATGYTGLPPTIIAPGINGCGEAGACLPERSADRWSHAKRRYKVVHVAGRR